MMKAEILTFTGRVVNVINPDPKTISLLDIAHALAHQNRFNGHSIRPSNVAMHSRVVAIMIRDFTQEQQITAKALLHDASEAYLGDMVHPLKVVMPAFRQIEDQFDDVLDEIFQTKVSKDELQLIKFADISARAWEQRDLMRWSSTTLDPRNPFTIPKTSYPRCEPSVDMAAYLDMARSIDRLASFVVEAETEQRRLNQTPA